MTPMLYILGTSLSIAFVMFGWSGDFIIHKICLIVGGVYFGHILTEALNYVERPFNNDNTNEGA